MNGLVNALSLSPLCRTIIAHLERTGSISAREAMADYGITSATLSRRILDIKGAGFKISHVQRKHPVTGRRYTRYVLVKEVAA